MTTLDDPSATYDIPTMFWPNLYLGMDVTGRYAAICQLADSGMTASVWAQEMLSHTSKHLALGWPIGTAMQKAARECHCYLPKEL